MGRIRTYKKMNEVYIFFLIRVLPILLVPVMVMVAIYYWSIDIINQKTYEKNLAILQSSAETIKKTFNNMDNLITYISGSPSINRFYMLDNPLNNGATTVDILDIQRELKALTIANDLLQNIQIYSKFNNTLIDSTTNALSINRYYTSSFTIKNMSLDDWYNLILSVPHKYEIYSNLDIINKSQKQKSLLYAQSMPLAENQDIGGVYVFLDEAYLLKLFRNIPYEKSGFIYILDKNGKPFLYNNGTELDKPMADAAHFTEGSSYFHQKINGRDMFVTYYKDTSRNWVYVAALPRNQVLAPTAGIRLYIGILILLSLLAGIVLLVLSVKKLSAPITNVYSLLSKKNETLSYGDFEHEISKLVENNEEMQAVLEKQILELKGSIFHNLLTGRYQSEQEILENLSKINLKFCATYYVVLIASINDLEVGSNLEEISTHKVYVNSVLSKGFDNVQGIYNLDYERTVLLLSFDMPNYIEVMEQVEKDTESIVELLYSSARISISFSGDIAQEITKIPSSFFNANIAISYKQKIPFYTVQWFKKAVYIDQQSFYYPIELETKIISLVNSGNYEKLPELFEKIERRNKYNTDNDDNHVFYNLLQSMNSTITRIFNDSDNLPSKAVKIRKNIIEQLEKPKNMLQTFYLFKDAFMLVAEYNSDEIRKKDNVLLLEVRGYIDKNYTDAQLSLTSVANVFSITEVYLSYLFKQETGENFSKYVERLRMERALQLIVDGNLLMNEIAETVGYNSPQVFRRAYKRYYGNTPSGTDKNKTLIEK